MAELIWRGKYGADGHRTKPGDQNATLRLVERCGADADATCTRAEWRNQLIRGDLNAALPALLPEFAGAVDLVYVDPPFGTGNDFALGAGSDPPTARGRQAVQTAFQDRWGRDMDRYLTWFHDMAYWLRELMAPQASLYVHLDANAVHYAKVILDELFPHGFQREIVWRIGWVSGYKAAARNYVRNHDTILFYTRDPACYTFHKQYVPYRAGYRRRGQQEQTGRGYAVEDVWNANPSEAALTGEQSLDSIQIRSLSREKTGYPTQKNEALLNRIIATSSNPGDLVLDCCCGSGTTPVVAEKLGRRWIACDIGDAAIDTARIRLLALPATPFDVLEVRPRGEE